MVAINRCIRCGHTFRVPDRYRGKFVYCDECVRTIKKEEANAKANQTGR